MKGNKLLQQIVNLSEKSMVPIISGVEIITIEVDLNRKTIHSTVGRK